MKRPTGSPQPAALIRRLRVDVLVDVEAVPELIGHELERDTLHNQAENRQAGRRGNHRTHRRGQQISKPRAAKAEESRAPETARLPNLPRRAVRSEDNRRNESQDLQGCRRTWRRYR